MYDRVKDRRYGALFLSCLLGSFGLLILAAIFGKVVIDFELRYVLAVLPVIGLLAVARMVLGFREFRRRRLERHKYPPLSRDEMRVARSKLLKERTEKL